MCVCVCVCVSIYIYIESLMSCHLLLNLLHELANMILSAEHNIIFANECNKFSNK